LARLAVILRSDPSSAIAAALEGWDHPISREALLLADLYDLNAAINSPKNKRPKPHPMRPWKNRDVQRRGNTGGRTRAQVEAILAAARGRAA
jgi:hypothetical protein